MEAVGQWKGKMSANGQFKVIKMDRYDNYGWCLEPDVKMEVGDIGIFRFQEADQFCKLVRKVKI